jgi:hypothetical protein
VGALKVRSQGGHPGTRRFLRMGCGIETWAHLARFFCRFKALWPWQGGHDRAVTTRRVLEDLAAYGLITRQSQGQGKPDLWLRAKWDTPSNDHNTEEV